MIIAGDQIRKLACISKSADASPYVNIVAKQLIENGSYNKFCKIADVLFLYWLT